MGCPTNKRAVTVGIYKWAASFINETASFIMRRPFPLWPGPRFG